MEVAARVLPDAARESRQPGAARGDDPAQLDVAGPKHRQTSLIGLERRLPTYGVLLESGHAAKRRDLFGEPGQLGADRLRVHLNLVSLVVQLAEPGGQCFDGARWRRHLREAREPQWIRP